jgi:hypothetical protein
MSHLTHERFLFESKKSVSFFLLVRQSRYLIGDLKEGEEGEKKDMYLLFRISSKLHSKITKKHVVSNK